jgi:hypothetical protein
LVGTFLLALIEASIPVLTLLVGGAAILLATEHRNDSRDALSVVTAEPALAVARRLTSCRRVANVSTAVLVLALLAYRATVALAAEHRGESGDALTIETAEPGLAIASGAAFPFLSAEAPPAVSVLAWFAGRTLPGVAAVHRCDTR